MCYMNTRETVVTMNEILNYLVSHHNDCRTFIRCTCILCVLLLACHT